MVCSMLKLKVGRLARRVTDTCLQFWGGMGFTEEVLYCTVLYCTVLHCTGHCNVTICVQVMVSRLYRDLRLGSIAGGADEIMLGIICKLAEMGPTKH